MERPTRPGSARSEAGFTLAGLIVVMTVMMIFVAYTVPRQWSTVMQRERELQTIFIMKQYARAIDEFSRKSGGAYPVSMNQLKDAKLPRYLRAKGGEYADPLTGEVDWLIVPQSASVASSAPPPGAQTAQATTTMPAISMKDYAGGPFIGVRPGKTGKSMLELNGAQNYEQWSYTVIDYRTARDAHIAAASKIWQ